MTLLAASHQHERHIFFLVFRLHIISFFSLIVGLFSNHETKFAGRREKQWPRIFTNAIRGGCHPEPKRTFRSTPEASAEGAEVKDLAVDSA